MDIFRVLTRGASVKKESGPKAKATDYSIISEKDENLKEDNKESQIEKELDFFRNKRIIKKVDDDKEMKIKEESWNESNESGNGEDLIKPVITNATEASALRKSYKGNVSGIDVPLPIGSFEDLISRFSFDKRLLNNLVENGFTEPTPIQSECIPVALNNRDVLACGPTAVSYTHLL